MDTLQLSLAGEYTFPSRNISGRYLEWRHFLSFFCIVIYYLIVLVASFVVDLIPAFGPPAWSVMIIMQVKFDLQIGWVLLAGVTGSTLGRYMLSKFLIPRLADRVLKEQKKDEFEFLGNKLNQTGWRSSLFVFIYTLVPIPTAPLFTVAGVARVKAIHIIPPFFLGKFTSDAMMVFAGKYASDNMDTALLEISSMQSILSVSIGLLLISILLFLDWRVLLMKKKVKLNFKIWK